MNMGRDWSGFLIRKLGWFRARLIGRFPRWRGLLGSGGRRISGHDDGLPSLRRLKLVQIG